MVSWDLLAYLSFQHSEVEVDWMIGLDLHDFVNDWLQYLEQCFQHSPVNTIIAIVRYEVVDDGEQLPEKTLLR